MRGRVKGEGASGYDAKKPQKITIKANGANPHFAQLMAVWCQQWAHGWTCNDTHTEFTFFYDEVYFTYKEDGRKVTELLNFGRDLMDENLLSHFYWAGYRKRSKCLAVFNGALIELANQTEEEQKGIGNRQKPDEWFFDERWNDSRWDKILFPKDRDELWIKDEDFPIIRALMKKEVKDDKRKAQTKKWGAMIAEKLAYLG